MDTVKIEGIEYVIERAETDADLDAKGLHNVARMMRANKINRQLLLRRQNGKKFYFTNEYITRHGITHNRPFSL